MGGAGGNLLGVPWGFKEGGPCLVCPARATHYVREPLELFPLGGPPQLRGGPGAQPCSRVRDGGDEGDGGGGGQDGGGDG